MQALETIHRQNASAALRAQQAVPPGATHMIHCFNGLNLVKTVFATGADDLAKLRDENTDLTIGNNVEVEAV